MTQDRQREHEREQYVFEHVRIFGHVPILDLSGRHQCSHPGHRELEAILNAPGVDIELPFNPREVATEDDPAVIAAKERYEDRVEHYRARIAAIEEREAFVNRPDLEKKRLF